MPRLLSSNPFYLRPLLQTCLKFSSSLLSNISLSLSLSITSRLYLFLVPVFEWTWHTQPLFRPNPCSSPILELYTLSTSSISITFACFSSSKHLIYSPFHSLQFLPVRPAYTFPSCSCSPPVPSPACFSPLCLSSTSDLHPLARATPLPTTTAAAPKLKKYISWTAANKRPRLFPELPWKRWTLETPEWE